MRSLPRLETLRIANQVCARARGVQRAHVAFVNMHHHQIERLAVVTGAPFLRTVAAAASALLSPEVRLFDGGDTMKALDWLTERSA